MDLTLNIQQRLICHKPNQPTFWGDIKRIWKKPSCDVGEHKKEENCTKVISRLKKQKKYILMCSSNAMNNLTSKKQKVCSLCYRHAETRRRKGHERCDLFYGGECDKST